jgi:hypothetical protein
MELCRPSIETVAGQLAMRDQPAAWTAARYRELFGWAAERRDGRTRLPLGNGIVAVVMPESVARPVANHLACIEACGPVVAEQAGPRLWAFLADPNGIVASQDLLPAGVCVLGCPNRLAIPAADSFLHELVWAVPPDPSRRWLPTLTAVISAARASAGCC